MKGKCRDLLFLLPAVFLLFQCEPPAGSVTGSIRGTVRDYYTGAGIYNATVGIGNRSVQTDGMGSFSLSYSPAETAAGDVFVYKGVSYSFWSVCDVRINTALNPQYTFYLMNNNLAGLPSVTISGDLPGAAAAGGFIRMYVTNSAGGLSPTDTQNFAGAETQYSLNSVTFGPDCVIVVFCDLDGSGVGANPIIQYYTGQDLSRNLDLDISDLGTTAVTFAGPANEYFFSDLDCTPVDAQFYPWYEFLAAGPMNFPQLSGTGSYSADIYDGGLPLVWTTFATSVGPAPDFVGLHFNAGSSTSFSANVQLPMSAAVIPAPTTAVSGPAWDQPTRVLSFTGGSGATMHVCNFDDGAGHQGFIFANSPSTAISLTLPADFYTDVIATRTWNVKIMPADANRSINDFITMRIRQGGPSDVTDLQLCVLMSPGNNDLFNGLVF